jgi:hypothetical protein
VRSFGRGDLWGAECSRDPHVIRLVPAVDRYDRSYTEAWTTAVSRKMVAPG